MKVNIFISEMAAHFRQATQHKPSSSSEDQAATPGEVPCDFCTDPKRKALKSCLVCLASFCNTHLEPHLTMEILKRHQLINPQENLERRGAEQVVQRTEAEIQQMIATRQEKIQELARSLELSNRDANTEIVYSVQAFTALKESVERDLDRLIQEITRKKKATEDKAKGFMKDLDQEISELRKCSNEINTTPPMKDWTNFSVRVPTFEGSAVRSMAQLERTLNQQMSRVFVAELQRVQKHRVNVMLDPDRVHPTSTNQGNAKGKEPVCKCVLARQCFSSGKSYFEVDVRGRSKWTLGLAKELHINRQIELSPGNAYWVIGMRNKTEWYAAAEPSVRLSMKSRPEKVGVFLDYEEGLVSFYDADVADLIYAFTGCSFTKKLHPFFSPCENDGAQLHTPPDSSCILQ